MAWKMDGDLGQNHSKCVLEFLGPRHGSKSKTDTMVEELSVKTNKTRVGFIKINVVYSVLVCVCVCVCVCVFFRFVFCWGGGMVPVLGPPPNE